MKTLISDPCIDPFDEVSPDVDFLFSSFVSDEVSPDVDFLFSSFVSDESVPEVNDVDEVSDEI